MEIILRKNKDTCIAFVDLEKAFDNIKWDVLFSILKEIQLKYKDRRVIWNLYRDEVAIVKCGENIEDPKIQKGVRQGCALSPALFNIYIQKGLDEVREQGIRGIKAQGEKVGMLRIADDIAILVENAEELMIILNKINAVLSTSYAMRINRGTTKVLIVNKNGTASNITLDGSPLDNVHEFTYLGS